MKIKIVTIGFSVDVLDGSLSASALKHLHRSVREQLKKLDVSYYEGKACLKDDTYHVFYTSVSNENVVIQLLNLYNINVYIRITNEGNVDTRDVEKMTIKGKTTNVSELLELQRIPKVDTVSGSWFFDGKSKTYWKVKQSVSQAA